eukprot:gene12180-14255_t
MEKIWYYTFYNIELLIVPEPEAQGERTAWFSTYMDGVLKGRTIGTVMQCGDGDFFSVPVYEGKAFLDAIIRSI